MNSSPVKVSAQEKNENTCQRFPYRGILDMAAEQNAQSLDSAFYQSADTFFSGQAGTALTYDDLTLASLYSEILPRISSLVVAPVIASFEW